MDLELLNNIITLRKSTSTSNKVSDITLEELARFKVIDHEPIVREENVKVKVEYRYENGMKFTNTEVFNFDGAFRGMRNPMNSWDKSDGRLNIVDRFIMGENDIKLAQKLILAGTEHCKFMRQIMVSVDITAPLYWWKEFDTYKVGTTANSTSTMHKLSTTPITIDCFEIDDYDNNLGVNYLDCTWNIEGSRDGGYLAEDVDPLSTY